ncbi:sulfatase [Candidatus Hydrogenedentota bacterium]
MRALVAGVMTLIVCASALGVETPEDLGRPNILYIITDQQRADAMSCAGNPVVKTPNMDRLARAGAMFTNAFVCTGQCVPSRQATITGRYPHANRVQWNSAPLADDELTVAEIMNEQGYKSVAVGKMHFVRRDASHGFEYRNIGSHAWPHGEYKEYLDKNNIEWTTYDFKPEEGEKESKFTRYIASGTTDVPEKFFYTTYTADVVLEKLEELKDEAFCMWVGFNGPHHPHYPPEPWASMYDPKDIPLPEWIENEFANKPEWQKAFFMGDKHKYYKRTPAEFKFMLSKYYGFVSLVDKNVGRIMDKLEELGIEENTIVVFTSDHGDYMGEHRLALKSVANYDATTHVPLIVRYPKKIKPGQVRDELVGNVDHLATILELAGVPEPLVGRAGKEDRRLLQGKSFAPLLEGKSYQPSDALFFEMGGNDMESQKLKGIRTKKWKYNYNHGQVDELYDLEKDPGELYNLVGEKRYASVIREMRGCILEWLISTEDNRLVFPDIIK